MFPDWVEKYHTKGTSVKKINNSYYLYKVTSRYSKEKGYPVSIQKYLGKITEFGLIEATKVYFTPGIDEIIPLKDLIDIKDKDLDIIGNIGIVIINGKYYTGKLNSKEKKTLTKYVSYNEGKIEW